MYGKNGDDPPSVLVDQYLDGKMCEVKFQRNDRELLDHVHMIVLNGER